MIPTFEIYLQYQISRKRWQKYVWHQTEGDDKMEVEYIETEEMIWKVDNNTSFSKMTCWEIKLKQNTLMDNNLMMDNNIII